MYKVGVLSCSGEEYFGGTIARLATRKVMEELRIGKTVTLCLPLYLAGGEEEREFRKGISCYCCRWLQQMLCKKGHREI